MKETVLISATGQLFRIIKLGYSWNLMPMTQENVILMRSWKKKDILSYLKSDYGFQVLGDL